MQLINFIIFIIILLIFINLFGITENFYNALIPTFKLQYNNKCLVIISKSGMGTFKLTDCYNGDYIPPKSFRYFDIKMLNLNANAFLDSNSLLSISTVNTSNGGNIYYNTESKLIQCTIKSITYYLIIIIGKYEIKNNCTTDSTQATPFTMIRSG